MQHRAAALMDPRTRGVARIGRLVVVAVLAGIGISHVIFAIREWPLGDMDVYLEAARRLRDGEPLYVAGDVAVNSYWYAPWYAALWVPLTYLPREIVAVGWSTILVTASAAVAWLCFRMGRHGPVLALFVGPPLFAVSAGGNIQGLMVLALLVGFHRSWGPAAVALAASMKFAPILLAAAYAARGEWLRAAVSVVLAGVLLLPSYLMGITEAGVRSEAAPSLLGISPILFGASILLVVIATFLVPKRFAALSASVASVLALPRLFVYDVTLVAVGAAKERVSGSEAAVRDGLDTGTRTREGTSAATHGS